MSYSYCKVFGKDKVIFVTKEDHATPSTIELPPPEPPQGIITADGKINWGCPCLGGMATGPCGVEFREAFSCFQYSEAEPKGSDCYDAFLTMRNCFQKYPTVYNKANAEDDDGMDENMENEASQEFTDNKTTAAQSTGTKKIEKTVVEAVTPAANASDKTISKNS